MSRIAEVLAALRNTREALLNEVSQIDRVIAALEGAPEPALVQREAVVQYPEDAFGRKPGPYSMLSVCEAAALYLREAGVPKTTGEIAAALKAGGFRTTAARFTDTVQKMLRASASRYGIRQAGKRWMSAR